MEVLAAIVAKFIHEPIIYLYKNNHYDCWWVEEKNWWAIKPFGQYEIECDCSTWENPNSDNSANAEDHLIHEKELN